MSFYSLFAVLSEVLSLVGFLEVILLFEFALGKVSHETLLFHEYLQLLSTLNPLWAGPVVFSLTIPIRK